MAMTFNKPTQAVQTATATPVQSTEIVEVKPYDIIADREESSKALAHSPEVEKSDFCQLSSNAATAITLS